MNVSSVARSLGITDDAVISKVKELIRLMSFTIPGGMGPGEVCKVSVCLELACNMCSSVLPLNRDVFVRWGCAPKKVYMTTFGLCQKVLGVGAAAPTMTELALKCGCEHLVRPAEILLSMYCKRFLKRLAAEDTAATVASNPAPRTQHLATTPTQDPISSHPNRTALQSTGTPMSTRAAAPGVVSTAAPLPGTPNKTVDFSRPAFTIAALQLTGMAQRGGRGQLKIDVRKILQQLGISNAQYQSVVEDFKELCAAELGRDEPDAKGADGEQGGGEGPIDAEDRQGDGVVMGEEEEEEDKKKRCKQRGVKGRGKGKGSAGGTGKRGKKRRHSDEESEGREGEDDDAGDVDEWEVLVRVEEKTGKGEKRQGAAGKRKRKNIEMNADE